MKKKVVPSLAEPVGNLWKDLQSKSTESGLFRVSSPLSSTPLPIYEWTINHAKEFKNWDKVQFVLMDEQLEEKQPLFVYVSTSDPASYEGFARKHLLAPLQEKTGVAVKVVKPEASHIDDFEAEIDLLILAIGPKGNYANVIPGTKEETGWNVTHLLPGFNQNHENQAYSGSHFREYGMSLGPQQVLSAKNVAVIISGEKKKDLAKQLLSRDSFDIEFPLSIIHHPKIREE